MRALVTGHLGFVGRHMVRELERRGIAVLGVDIKTGDDARDFFRNDRYVPGYDLVVHLAAIVGGRQTIESEPLLVGTDLSIDAEMFNWAARMRPGKVIYYSSSAAYPTALQLDEDKGRLLAEDAIDLKNIGCPDLTYGWAKLTGEMLSQHLLDRGIPTYVFRPFSGYGEDQDLAYPFPSFIARAKRRDDPFEIWGDGYQARDFIHISDVVNATLAIADVPVLEVGGPVNLCTGRATSFNELQRLVCDAAGYGPRVHHIPWRPVGVRHRVGDPTKMLRWYTPRVSLEQGIELALRAP